MVILDIYVDFQRSQAGQHKCLLHTNYEKNLNFIEDNKPQGQLMTPFLTESTFMCGIISDSNAILATLGKKILIKSSSMCFHFWMLDLVYHNFTGSSSHVFRG